MFPVAKQPYRVAVPEESVILGNDVVIKCNIPSFVADFLSVTAWVTSEGTEFQQSDMSGNHHHHHVCTHSEVASDGGLNRLPGLNIQIYINIA